MYETTTTTTDIATLPPADRAAIVLGSTKTELALRELVKEASTVIAVADPAGRELAHRLGMRLKNARITIEKTGKSAREDATAYSKAVIDEEKRLKAIGDAEETRIFALRDAYDAEIAAEKAAKEALDKARIDSIRAKIEQVRRLPLDLAGCTAEEIDIERKALTEFVPTEPDFNELLPEMVQVMADAYEALGHLYDRVYIQEGVAANVEAERVRLAEAERVANEALASERAKLEEQRQSMAAMQAKFEAQMAELQAERAAFEAIKTPAEPATEVPSIMFTRTVSRAEIEEMYPRAEDSIDADTALVGSNATIDTPEEADAENEAARASLDVTDVEAAPEVSEPAPDPVSDWTTRRIALATADQFDAMSSKVVLCGATSFGQELSNIAIRIRDGQFDANIADADFAAMTAADNAMLDATVNSIDAMGEEGRVAA